MVPDSGVPPSMTNFSMSFRRRPRAMIGPVTWRPESVTPISPHKFEPPAPAPASDLRRGGAPVTTVTFAAPATSLAPRVPPIALCRAKIPLANRGAHMFGCVPSVGAPTVRTRVLITADITTCSASARGDGPGPLVPLARGRLRRRLGGRPGRANPAGPPAPGAAAQEVRPPAGRAADEPCLPIPHLPRQAGHTSNRPSRSGLATAQAGRAPGRARQGRAHGLARGRRVPCRTRPARAPRLICAGTADLRGREAPGARNRLRAPEGGGSAALRR